MPNRAAQKWGCCGNSQRKLLTDSALVRVDRNCLCLKLRVVHALRLRYPPGLLTHIARSPTISCKSIGYLNGCNFEGLHWRAVECSKKAVRDLVE